MTIGEWKLYTFTEVLMTTNDLCYINLGDIGGIFNLEKNIILKFEILPIALVGLVPWTYYFNFNPEFRT